MMQRPSSPTSVPVDGIAQPPAEESRLPGESPYKSRGGIGRIAEALLNSWSGLSIALRIEAAFRQEVALAAVLAVALFALPFSAMERLLLAGSMILVLVVELVNSAVEAAIDRISLDNHHLSKRAKDLGSAAVFLALSFCATCWIVLGYPAFLRMAG